MTLCGGGGGGGIEEAVSVNNAVLLMAQTHVYVYIRMSKCLAHPNCTATQTVAADNRTVLHPSTNL
jgi:hypothetical protein